MDADGLQRESGENLNLDLDDHELSVTGNYVGSEGYKTNGLRFLKNSDVVLKDGTIKADDAKLLIQNYSNLTLDNVKLIGSDNHQVVLSNNFGNIILKNHTEIIASSPDKIAFDCYYGLLPQYDDGVTVTIADDTVKIVGKVSYQKDKRISSDDTFHQKAHVYIPEGYEAKLAAPDGYEWKSASPEKEGFMTLKKQGE